jgi:mannose-6-phosphate isomerase
MIRLTPKHFEKPWGSKTLEPWFPNPSEKTGEVWFTGVPDSKLLIKLLFTSEPLSVQVHPPGKTEMWHVLRAEPGARIAAGFIRELTEAEFRAHAPTPQILDLLQWHAARPGDTFFIPAGTVHAIGEGLVLCEIQQNSDITYRLYDYNRGREVHLDESVKFSHRGPHAARRQAEGTTLVSCEFFTTDKIVLAGSLRLDPTPAAPEWWVVIEGSAEIGGQPASQGEVWYAPPGHPRIDLNGKGALLRVSSGTAL